MATDFGDVSLTAATKRNNFPHTHKGKSTAMSDITPTPWTLILEAAAGDASRRGEFSDRYRPLISRILAARWKLAPQHHDVADATQEVFLNLLVPGGALETVDRDYGGSFRAYLFGVVRRVAARIERERRMASEVDADLIDDASPSFDEVLDQAWALHVVSEALKVVERRAQRTDAPLRLRVLELRYKESTPPREIAERLGLEPKRVYLLLKRARIEFRTALIEVVASYNPKSTEDEVLDQCTELINLLRPR